MKMYSMKETAALLGITYGQLQSAVFHQKIAEPKMRVGPHKLWSEAEVEAARSYFTTKKNGHAWGKKLC